MLAHVVGANIVCINNIDVKILEIYLIKILPYYFTEEYCGKIR